METSVCAMGDMEATGNTVAHPHSYTTTLLPAISGGHAKIMAMLGKVTVNALVNLGAVVSLSTILLSYGMAVAQGHIKLWLPSISSCGYRPPEEYVFRYGLLSGALLMAAMALVIYKSDMPFSKDSFILFTGVVAPLCLGVFAVCAYVENKQIHKTSGIIFFVLEDLFISRITLLSRGQLSRLSLVLKAVFMCLAWFGTLATGLNMHNIFEWVAIMGIIAFNWTFVYDFHKHYFLAVFEED